MNMKGDKKLQSLNILAGSPEEAGSAYAASVSSFSKELAAKRITFKHKDNKTYLKKYLGIVEKRAPHWIDEWKAVASTWNWPFSDVALLSLLRYAPPFADNCTSWLAMPDISADKSIMIHKNRDGGNYRQSLLVKHITGFHKWTGLADVGSHSPIFIVNDCGLAIMLNNGEPCTENNETGLTTPDIIRLLGETCSTAEEALGLYEDIISSGHYAHGKDGSITLLTDTRKACVIENSARRLAFAEVRFGFEVRSNGWFLPGMKAYSQVLPYARRKSDELRYFHIRDSLNAVLREKNCVSAEDFRRLARSQANRELNPVFPVYKEGTTSAASIFPHKKYPHVLTRLSVAIGPPGTAFFIPFTIGINKVPEILVNSKWSLNALELTEKHGLDCERILAFRQREKELHQNHLEVLNQAEKLLDEGKEDKAQELLSENFIMLLEKANSWFSSCNAAWEK
ncbi:MAG: carcinine hydrolase/isopenicillin-N N-acyltransferase family protein [Victivallales bacterium]|nr:carcinine hydrolase/isopenicillin-N N-acyltransferase family protein [Victivallales bacterium]